MSAKWSCYLCGLSSPHVHGPDTDVMSSVQAIEAAEDHADQVAFDAWRERGL